MTSDAPDRILEFLGTTKGWHDLATIAKRTGYGRNDVLRILPKLIRELYVEERFSERREEDRIYSISFDGIEFREKGGYASLSKAMQVERHRQGTSMTDGRKLAAIMFTDIVGYTSSMAASEQKALAMLSRSRGVQKPLIEQYNGQYIKESGDGTLASFNSAADAARCAVAIQKAIKEDEELRLRIGIDLDDVLFNDNDVFADGVNIAARLQSVANPGAIFISDAVYRTVRNKDDITIRFVRRMQLKNVNRPIDVHEVAVEGLFTEVVEPNASLGRNDSLQELFPGVWELEYDHHGTGNFGYDPWIEIKNGNEYHTSGSRAFLLENLSVDPTTKDIRFAKHDPQSGDSVARNVLRVVKPYELYEGKEEGITPVTYYRFPRRFGGWMVDELGISWTGGPEYMISASRLLETREGLHGLVYDWLVHMPEKTWLKESDILDLNEAFKFALRRFGLAKNSTISMDETLRMQRANLKFRGDTLASSSIR